MIDREMVRAEATERILRILDTGRWPTGMTLAWNERRLLIANARKTGIEVPLEQDLVGSLVGRVDPSDDALSPSVTSG